MDINKISSVNNFNCFVKNRINILLNLDLEIAYKILAVFAIKNKDYNLLGYLIDENLIDINETFNFEPDKIFDILFSKNKLILNSSLHSNCSICIENSNKINCELPCKHKFHLKCIIPWLVKNSNCPNCRKNI